MLKPFAISRREQFALTFFILGQQSADKAERKKRRALWEELGVQELKRQAIRTRTPEETKKAEEARISNPSAVDPFGLYAWLDEEPNVRIELHGSSIDYVIDKLSGTLPAGADAEYLGELCERLDALKGTDAAAICTDTGAGYRLPKALWTDAETRRAGMKALPQEQAASE